MRKGADLPSSDQPRTALRGAQDETPLGDAAKPDPFSMSDASVEAALVSGDQDGLLEDYFGPAQLAELKKLAREASARSVRGGERVLILPGIMGSKLGFPGDGLFDDVIWADPIDIAAGQLRKLSLRDGDARIGPVGVMLFTYLALKYRLRLAGYDASFCPYDWRRSLAELGHILSSHVKEEGDSRKVHLVTHSMGGLVARAALQEQPANLGRIIMLGTPNHGSFSPVQAFRGTHSIVRKVASIDLAHSQEELARDVFGTFPGLCEMMPSFETFGTDYFSLSSWPNGGVLPDQTLLSAARKAQQELPSRYDDLVIIAGANIETTVAATVRNEEFVYTTSLDGDGTVPLPSARLKGARKTYYVGEEHGSLPNNKLVARAVDQILATGETSVLPDRYASRRSGPLRTVSERALDVPPYEGRRGRPLSMRERRSLLDEFAAPDKAPMPAAHIEEPAPAAVVSLGEVEPALSDRVVIGRRVLQRLDITLARGSITEVDASAYVLGLFRNVAASGPARLLDRLLEGAMEQMLARRMFNANVGEISILPTGRHPVRADILAFAGLGPFDSFREDVLEVVAENVMRTFLATRIGDFATVLVGGASGLSTPTALRHLVTGFLRGLRGVDREQRFRGITISESDPQRFAALRREMLLLCATTLFDGFEITLRERDLPPEAASAGPRGPIPAVPESVYLIVRQEISHTEKPSGLSASVLTAGAKAAIFKGRRDVDASELEALLGSIETEDLDIEGMRDFGRRVGELVLPENVRSILERYADHPLVIVHDAGSSRIPWETLQLGSCCPALESGLSHRYEAEDLAIAKWLEERQQDATLDVLLVINPTNDLPGAAEEGSRLKASFESLGSAVRIEEIVGDRARKQELLRCFSSGEFDVVHYAGHAFFDAENPARSGIVCAGREILSGADLAGLGNLPSLVFFNACEAARVRRRGERRGEAALSIPKRVQRNVGFAEAFLCGGIANYVGTYWPVGDSAALAFAKTFYERLLTGSTLGEAILAGRQAAYKLPSIDWADYILYGDPNFVLKKR
jgi:pimeloyl-ACP methyl ester carboxylesterase